MALSSEHMDANRRPDLPSAETASVFEGQMPGNSLSTLSILQILTPELGLGTSQPGSHVGPVLHRGPEALEQRVGGRLSALFVHES